MWWKRGMQGPKPINTGGTGRMSRKGRKRNAPEHVPGSRAETGKQGEDMALEYLLQLEYRLLERNWRCRHKEVDLIMEANDGLHIVEVRTRKEPVAVEPELTVDRCKQHNLEAAARAWLRMKGERRQVHFDIMSIVLDSNGKLLRRRFIQDAFLPLAQ